MAETETKVDIPQPMETEQKVEKPEEKAPEVPEKSSKKSKKSKKEKKSRKNRSRSKSDSESTGESKSRERKASRSKSKSRSRSSTRKSHRRKKEKRSKKHRRSHSSESRSASSRSRSKSHSPRRRKHRRDSSYERRRRDRNNRSRDRHDDRRRNNRNDREHRPPRDRRRRSGTRSRSPHPLLRGAAASNHQESSVRNKIEDANKSKMFWDGFQWVAKVNMTGANVDPAVLAQTKKMRRLVISNLPLTLGIGENEVGDFVTKFIMENYLNDEGNFHPIKEVSIDTAKNSAIIELSSVEETNKLAKVEAIKILGSNCRVAKVGDPKLNSTVGNLITDAQYNGQAAAAALTALTMLSNKDANASFTLSKVNVLGSTSKILKVTNLVDPEHAKSITAEELQEIYEDISGEFGTIGKIADSFVVKKEKAVSGAEVGTVFLIFEESSGAEKVYNSMSNKRYENRDIRIIYVDEETFKKSFAHLKA